MKPTLQAVKIDDYSIEITKQPETIIPPPITTKYERDFIEKQIIAITTQRDEMIALKEKELQECQDILAKMDELEIVVKPIEDLKPLPVDEKIV